MQVIQTSGFQKAVKKLHKNQKALLDKAIEKILADPAIGEAKKGDLAGKRVYKFYMLKQLTLLAYSVSEKPSILTLRAFGSHENFYRDLKH